MRLVVSFRAALRRGISITVENLIGSSTDSSAFGLGMTHLQELINHPYAILMTSTAQASTHQPGLFLYALFERALAQEGMIGYNLAPDFTVRDAYADLYRSISLSKSIH